MGRTRSGQTGHTELPAIQLLSSVVFPNDVVSVQLPDDEAAGTLRDLEAVAEPIVATVYGKDPDERADADLRGTCVLCRVVQMMFMPGGGVQVVFQGLSRAEIVELKTDGDVETVVVRRLPEKDADTPGLNRRVLEVLDLISEYLPRDGTYPEDLETILRMNVKGPGRFADLVAAYLHLPLPVKRDVACAVGIEDRLAIITRALEIELQRFSVEADVHRNVRDHLEERQREQYLRQQMRAIRRELGDEGSPEEECDQLAARAAKAGLPKEAREIVEREVRRLRSISPSSAEYHVVRTYVGHLLDLPWKKRTRDRLDLARARKILEGSHSGLDKIKERIVEHLAVRKLKKDTRGPILCLVGPPGVGKTTLGKSIAEALGRKFARMSVGGLRDEAEIKGHRRTYVGAMPGKVMQLLKRTGVRNPVLQIDEIDKMGSDHRGDPSSAVLEVLDPETNSTFRDHYLDVGFNLSEVIFLVTANVLDTIPPALRDRLEVIRLGGYTREEKLVIAKQHLVPRAVENNGLKSKQVRFTPAGLMRIIEGFTREAGVREFERNLNSVCRKVATRHVNGDERAVSVGKRIVRELLGPERYTPDVANRQPEVGVATGLAWTAFGGATLTIEANRMPGKGAILVTGQLGDVMKESAQAALSFIRANAEEFDIDPDAFKDTDVHIHFPEGATPKDGPSAGVAIATCLASLFTGRAVRHDLAMTGEITLKGKVLEVGGIKEKLLAAHRMGIRTVLIPKANEKDLEDVPKEVRDELEILCAEEVETNICEALLSIIVPGAAVSAGALHEVESETTLEASSNPKRR